MKPSSGLDDLTTAHTTFISPEMSDPDRWLEQIKQCKYLPEKDMKQLCERVKELLMEESNIQPVSAPVYVAPCWSFTYRLAEPCAVTFTASFTT